MVSRNKRADLHISLSTLIDIVLVTIALLVLFGIYKAVISIFMDNPDKELASRNNFQRLATELNEMQVGQTREIPLYLLANRFIIAFQKDQTRHVVQCGLSIDNDAPYINKPPLCIGNCICLCKKSDWCKTTVECKTIEGDFTFKSTDTCPLTMISGSDKAFLATLSKEQNTVSFGVKPATT
jgi:hypothetical protein